MLGRNSSLEGGDGIPRDGFPGSLARLDGDSSGSSLAQRRGPWGGRG